MGSKLLFRFIDLHGTHGLNEEIGRDSTRNSSKAFFVSVSTSVSL